jgi:GTP-binding protein Era
MEVMMYDKQIKSGFVTLIGRPNVGKSTLMNHLIGQKIAITSGKPQTTRNKIQTVFTDERGQVIFLDTPGIHKAKNKLGQYMVSVAERTLKEVDIVLWLVEPSTFIGAGERHIAEQLRTIKTPVILVINKIDTVSKNEILTFINAYKDVLNFAEIIPVSALKGENTDQLMKIIFDYLPYGPLYYDEDTITDQPERQIVAELIREKALRFLEEEIPHGIAVSIDQMSERGNREYDVNTLEEIFSGIIDIHATIICERDSHKGIIIGKGGAMLKKIGTSARKEIENLLDCQVNLQLWVKVKKDWRDSNFLLKNYGYNVQDKVD